MSLKAKENGQHSAQTGVGWQRDGRVEGPWELFKSCSLYSRFDPETRLAPEALGELYEDH